MKAIDPLLNKIVKLMDFKHEQIKQIFDMKSKTSKVELLENEKITMNV